MGEGRETASAMSRGRMHSLCSELLSACGTRKHEEPPCSAQVWAGSQVQKLSPVGTGLEVPRNLTPAQGEQVSGRGNAKYSHFTEILKLIDASVSLLMA